MCLRRISFVKSILLASFVLMGHAIASLGQAPATATYKEYPPDATLLANKKAAEQQVGRVMRGTQPFDDTAKRQLDAYYKNLVFREFTTKENWGALPELRAEVLKELRAAKKNTPAFQHVVDLSFQQMRSFTQSKFQLHPAVRYNAMLLIADLNATEIGTPTPNGRLTTLPDPLPIALDAMIAEYQSADQIDAVRVAALVGIDRHVKLDLGRPVERRIPNTKKIVIRNEMIALLNAPPPATRSPEGHTWMQRRAVDILAAFGMVGPYPEANAALEKIVADKDAPISLRCTASEALARWAPSNNKIDASAVSRNLGLIAVKACKDELDRIAAIVKQEEDMKKLRELIKKPHPAATGQFGQMAGGAGDYGGGEGMYGGGEMSSGAPDMGAMDSNMYGGGEGMYGGGMGMYGGPGVTAAIPTDPRIVWSQRRLKYQLTCVKQGLTGMAIAGKSSPHEKVVSQIAKAVDAALVLTDPPAEKPDLAGLTVSIQKGLNGLAFLAPEAAVTIVEPTSEVPPGAAPAAPAAAPPNASTAAPPVANPTAPPAADAAPSDLPPGL